MIHDGFTFKVKVIFCCLGIALIMIWGTCALFFPIIIIDGERYSQQQILKVKKQHVTLYTQRLASFTNETRDTIENQYLIYRKGLSETVFPAENEDALPEIIRDFYDTANTLEIQTIAAIEDILRHKSLKFSLPLQTRTVMGKSNILESIFSTRPIHYLIEDRLYNKIAIDVVIGKLEIFKEEFPQIAHESMQHLINTYYEHITHNINSQTEIDINTELPLRDTVAYLRNQGETLWFFDQLIKECDVTDYPQKKFTSIETLNIAAICTPVLLPVKSTSETVHDAFALGVLHENMEALKNNWDLIRKENYSNIINNQQEIIMRNLTSYNNIDNEINMQELSDLVNYYKNTAHSSEALFMSIFNQTLLDIDDSSNFTHESFAIDISPLPIDVAVINGTMHDAYALKQFAESLEFLRNKWNIIKKESYQLIINDPQKTSENINERSNIDYAMDTEKLAEQISYYTHQVRVSEKLFASIFDQTILDIDNRANYKRNSSFAIDIAPLPVDVAVINGVVYDRFALVLLYDSMEPLRNEWEVRSENYRKIINNQRMIIKQNLESYDDIDNNINIELLAELIEYYTEQAAIYRTIFEKCRINTGNIPGYKEASGPAIDISPLPIDAALIGGTVYDILAFDILTVEVEAIWSTWLEFIYLENQKMEENIKKYFQDYFTTMASGQFVDSDMESIVKVLDYIIEQDAILRAFLPYFYDCSSLPDGQYTYVMEISGNDGLFAQPPSLNVIEIDEIPYYATAVTALQDSMRYLAGTEIMNHIRSDLTEIINSKIDLSVENVDAFLAWYFDWLERDLLTVIGRGLKTAFTEYNKEKDLLDNYRAHFFSFLEMENEIQSTLLLYDDIIQDLALAYVMALDEFQVEPFGEIQTEQTITGDDFMKPCRVVPDYIRSFSSNGRNLMELSVIRSDDAFINQVRIWINIGTDVLVDKGAVVAGAAAGAAVGSIFAGVGAVPGAVVGGVVGQGISIVAGILTDKATSEAVEKLTYNDYKKNIVDSFEKTRNNLMELL